VLDRHRYRLKDRRVYRAALRIWADEGGTDKIWKANPTRSTWPGPRRKRRSYTPRGAIIDYLQTVGRVILGVELKPGQARKYVQRVFRRARAPFAGVGRLTADTYVLHAGEA
jgi:hypothetical protein